MSVVAPANAERIPVSLDARAGIVEAGTVLASAARTATTNGPDMTNPGYTGVIVYIDITVNAVSCSNVYTIQGKDPVSGTYNTILASVAKTAVGYTVLTVLPSATASANVTINAGIPATWRVICTAGNANSATYSIGYSYIG
jgi:hypothetical protein